jgi:hypothetical protein
MLIGLFESSKPALYELINSLSMELGFDVKLLKDVDEVTIEKLDGLVVTDEFKSSASIAGILKQFKNILLLDPLQASDVVDQELLIICEEANVDLMVAGPALNPHVFSFIRKYAKEPFYIRVIHEDNSMGGVGFDVLYKSLYWNAFFSDGDIRRIKVNALPSVNDNGVVFYGKTESAKSIPVDTWFTNLGFGSVQLVKVFSQTNVVELDCSTWTFKMKDTSIEKVDNCESGGNSQEPFVRSFIEQLMGEEVRSLNVSISNFLKIKELYAMALQKLTL